LLSPDTDKKNYQFDKKKNENNVLCGLIARIAGVDFNVADNLS
jgi:hypothetical protein